MAVVAGVLSETRRRTLEAVCDTVVPSIEVDTEDAAATEFYARAASDLGVAAQIEGLMAQSMMPEEIEGVGRLIDAIGDNDFVERPVEARTEILHAVASSSPEAKLGVRQLRGLTLLFFYALPDAAGPESELGGVGICRADFRRATAGSRAEDDHR